MRRTGEGKDTLTAARLRHQFEDQFPGSPAPTLWRAPGRVNLIGEHTDYNEGYVLPVAIGLACYAAWAPAEDGYLSVYSANSGELKRWKAGQIGGLPAGGDWGDYVLGVATELRFAGFPVPPGRLLLSSRVPVGSGLSSSASLEVAAALALLNGRALDPLELVHLCRRAENQFVGTPCGIMDQYISLFGQEHAALCIDCRSLDSRAVSLPDDAVFLAVNSMVKHSLGQSAYRQRVNECQDAQRRLGKTLREASLSDLAILDGDRIVRRRARHVVSENQRVQDFVEASARGDLAAMGALLNASHDSLRDDYEVSCEELDFLVETSRQAGAYGARMIGGGFGGCTINLLPPDAVDHWRHTVTQRYQQRFGITPQFYPCQPAAGAGLLLESA